VDIFFSSSLGVARMMKQKSTIKEFYHKELFEKKSIPFGWKRKLAGNIYNKALDIEAKLHKEKNKDKIINEFINIIKKIILTPSQEEVIDFIISSMLTIEGSISNHDLKTGFRRDIIDDFLEKMDIEMIAPFKGESFRPELHIAIGGKSITQRVDRVESIGIREKHGKIIKKAMVIVD
jgi:molecular chaperone GrpE (heat shock protein)